MNLDEPAPGRDVRGLLAMSGDHPLRVMPAPRRQPNMLTTIHPGSVGEEGLVLEAAGNSSYPLLDVMWTMFLFFAAVLWFWLIIAILTDVFRRRDMSGWGKAGWTLFVI